ncbi:hypothetical protein [Stenotrophomonas maltophilia]|uniref:hypothetical protein n=1 Tax=Stenotrophomonas maltophilia TaxID=40324 RepID=UPI000B4D9E0C|nr:hypothetical protein [Stenotrophomonas maltophilia]OWQ61356.1 hypothetical protein CEE58_16140 [Stenotrophomonas maltophilia]
MRASALTYANGHLAGQSDAFIQQMRDRQATANAHEVASAWQQRCMDLERELMDRTAQLTVARVQNNVHRTALQKVQAGLAAALPSSQLADPDLMQKSCRAEIDRQLLQNGLVLDRATERIRAIGHR